MAAVTEETVILTCLNCSSIVFKWPRGQWLLRWAVCSLTAEHFPSLPWAAAGPCPLALGLWMCPGLCILWELQPQLEAPKGTGQPSRPAPSPSLGSLVWHSCSGRGRGGGEAGGGGCFSLAALAAPLVLRTL